MLGGNFDLLVKMSWNIHIFPEIDKQVFTFIKIEFRIAFVIITHTSAFDRIK